MFYLAASSRGGREIGIRFGYDLLKRHTRHFPHSTELLGKNEISQTAWGMFPSGRQSI